MNPLFGPTDEWEARRAARKAGRAIEQAAAPSTVCAHLGPILGRVDCGCDGGDVHACQIHGRCLPRPPSKPLAGRTLHMADGTQERIAVGQRVQACGGCQDSTSRP